MPRTVHANGFTNGHTNGHYRNRFKPDVHLDGFNTRAVHVGSDPDPLTGAVIPPLNLSTTYKQSGAGKHKGFEYSRTSNPSRHALEQVLASIESGGSSALCFASGSATTATVIQALEPGSHVLSVNDVYGGSRRFMDKVAPGNGVTVEYLDMSTSDETAIRTALKPETKLVWVETPTNPTLRLISIRLVSQILHSLPSPRPLLVVDNTFLSPYLSSPLQQGADIVVHSLTKFINGHSDVVMGAAIIGETAEAQAFGAKLKFLQNAVGAVPSPHDCYLVQRSIKTLSLRMKAHSINALYIAQKLAKSPYVSNVIYPGLASHPAHSLAYESLSSDAKKWVDGLPETKGGAGDIPYGGMLSFYLPSSSSPEALDMLLTSPRLFTLAESLGGVESLLELPSVMTHGSVPEEDRKALGIEGLVRVSAGIEEAVDLWEDLEEALKKAYDVDLTVCPTP